LAILATIWSARKSFKFSSDTLEEMREQRFAAYKPELVIPRFRVIIDDLDDGICYSRNKEYNKLNDKPISLDIVNLGQGVAKNIKIEYKINRNCFLAIHNKLKNEGMTDGIQFYEKGSELLEGIFEENKDRDILILNNGYDTLIFDEMISFLLPISKSPDNSTYSIFIKNYYIELYLIYIKEKELFKDLEFPAIEVRLEYCDLIYNSKPYIHNYIVKPIFVYESHHEYLYSVFVWIEPKKLE
ncbi:MAG TPA: hypothetical protein VHO28_10645, partial [Ignavibacteriales bacterium]|nr:hypothetical protein [Ignavibacteriales bacterium]